MKAALEALIAQWEARSRDALPADAMLINKHIRELRETLAAPPAERGAHVAVLRSMLARASDCSGTQEDDALRYAIRQLAAASAAPVGWQPIEIAPRDNKRPLYLARFNPDTGELQGIDWDGSWECDSESWELPQVYYYWASACNTVEEPTHWAYQDEPLPPSKTP